MLSNMKKIFFLVVFILSVTPLLAQFGSQEIVSTSQLTPFGLQSADLDNDGDLDLIVSSEGDNRIIWYENKDGEGNFGGENVITTLTITPRSIYTSDLDGDGDLDVLSASIGDNKLAWYENIDGHGTFGNQVVISTVGDQVICVYTSDLDNDGDQDVLSASHFDNTLRWFENLDGLANFGPENIISTEAGDPYYIRTADLDHDGFLDVFFSGLNGHKIGWHRNIDGSGNFGPEQIITLDIEGGLGIAAIDLDGDSYTDVLGATGFDGEIFWFKNLDGLGNFGTKQLLSTTCAGGISLDVKDLDSDGDIDVLATCLMDNKIIWIENENGLGDFGEDQIISEETQGASYIIGADVNNDGKLDVISTSYGDNKVAWYENQMLLSIEEERLVEFYIYPNPTSSKLYIYPADNLVGYKIYSSIGQLIIDSKITTEIDLTALTSGFYIIHLRDINNKISLHRVIKI